MFKTDLARVVQLSAALLMLHASVTGAWTVAEKQFLYDGSGVNDYIGTKSWNSKEIIDGMGMLGVGVHGDPDPAAPFSCPRVTNCKADSCWASWLPSMDSARQTGLYLSTFYTPACPDSAWKGFSYFGVVPDVGFAMRSWTGMKPYDQSPSFWHPNLNAPNKNISGIYGVIRPQWIMKPWSAACSGADCDHKVRVAIVADHQVVASNAPRGTQLQQNTRIVFLQEACDRKVMPCQFELNSKALCQGKSCGHVTVAGADPAQGGIPFLGGFVKGPGVAAYAPATGKPIWTSWGSATQRLPFKKTRFQLEISWQQLRNILEAIAVARGGDGSSPSIADTFGGSWAEKSNWVLIEAGFGQEIYNPSLNNRAYVGGNVQALKVLAISH